MTLHMHDFMRPLHNKYIAQFGSQSAEDKARFSPPVPSPPPMDDAEELMRQQLQAKEQELQKLKLELELAETRAKLEEQKKQVRLTHKYGTHKTIQNHIFSLNAIFDEFVNVSLSIWHL